MSFDLQFDWRNHRRIIGGKEVIVHCHHYNSRLQHTIESATAVDGKTIIRTSAESVFSDHVTACMAPDADAASKWQRARDLYAHLGFGDLDVSRVAAGNVEATTSHFVEGWNAGFPGRAEPVCTMTEGFLAGAHHAITGESVRYRETACKISGAPHCRFELVKDARDAIQPTAKRAFTFTSKPATGFPPPGNIDSDKIVQALVGMPIHGDHAGLIPAFGVYLANTPADFYNMICIRFIEEMTKHGLARNAQRLLVGDAETCAMNTFRGIMSSPEWDGLVAPMIQNQEDSLYGIVAVSNALGWGNWYVSLLESGSRLKIESVNGYEAFGFREMRGVSHDPQCYMLRGVAAGIMALVYATGGVKERFGTYASVEESCICADKPSCVFDVVRS